MKNGDRVYRVEDYSLVVNEYFGRLDFEGFVTFLKLVESKDSSGRLIANLSTCVQLFSKVLFEDVFTEQKADQRMFFNGFMESLTTCLGMTDPKYAKLLLIPVTLLMQTEFDEVDHSRAELEEFYACTNILRLWPSMHPRVWSMVANAYQIVDEVSFAIQQELKVANGPAHLRERVNRYLTEMRGNPRTSLGDFALIAVGLPDIWDLVDIELFLSVFPDEICLTPTSKRTYKPSFARKIAMASIVRFVNEHQQTRRPIGLKTGSTAQHRDQVVECCKAANLDLAATSKYNNDARYFYHHLKRVWLFTALRHSALRSDELYDHIQSDDSLVESLFLNSMDDPSIPAPILADIALSHERLRTSLLQKRQFIDDQILQMLISVSQSGRREKWIDLFGPKKSQAFVLPFELGDKVVVIDQIHDLSLIDTHLSTLPPRSVISVDVFFNIWRDVVLERPLPNVLAIATESRVFVIMAKRMAAANREKRSVCRQFLARIFCDPKLLKLTPFWQFGGKFHSLVSLWADDPFELDNTVCQTGTLLSQPAVIGPCLDIARKVLTPQTCFADVCGKILGGITVCDFEENSNWDNLYLRNSQLHYIATRTWLTLQIFFAETDLASIRPHVIWVDLNKLSAPGMYSQWRGTESELESWMNDNEARCSRFTSLVSSSQPALWENLAKDVRNDSALTCDTSLNCDSDLDQDDNSEC